MSGKRPATLSKHCMVHVWLTASLLDCQRDTRSPGHEQMSSSEPACRTSHITNSRGLPSPGEQHYCPHPSCHTFSPAKALEFVNRRLQNWCIEGSRICGQDFRAVDCMEGGAGGAYLKTFCFCSYTVCLFGLTWIGSEYKIIQRLKSPKPL